MIVRANKYRRLDSNLAGSIAVASGDSITVASGGSLTVASGATLSVTNTVLTPTGATGLTLAQSGTTVFLNVAGGYTVTLPVATTAGTNFEFIVKTAPTTAYIILSATNDNIVGYPIASLGSDETANGNAAADQINFVANVSLPSDRVRLISDGTSWQALATCKATGAITFTG